MGAGGCAVSCVDGTPCHLFVTFLPHRSFLSETFWGRMRYSITVISLALCSVCSLHAQDKASIENVRGTLSEWVQARQLTSRLQAEWRSEKEMLEQTAALYEKEIGDLKEQLAKADTSSTQVQEERTKLEAEKTELGEATAKVSEWVNRFERRLRELSAAFPPPLASKLDHLMKRLPEEPDKARLSPVERMQNLVGILNEVDKFNSSISVESELQKRPSGEELQVKTLYVGLGQAYFVDKTGDFAGVGIPSKDGWQWAEAPGLGGHILKCIAIYENTQPPAFVELPLVIR